MVIFEAVGLGFKVKAIGLVVIGLGLIGAGIFVFYNSTTVTGDYGNAIYGLLALVGFGIIAILFGWLYWRRGRKLIQTAPY